VNDVFVLGTDTEIGKTRIAGLIAAYFLEVIGAFPNNGLEDQLPVRKLITQKWIQTGISQHEIDLRVHESIIRSSSLDTTTSQSFLKAVFDEWDGFNNDRSPFEFEFPGAPNLCSFLENSSVSVDKIKQSYFSLSDSFETVIVEGLGGAFVPLDSQTLLIDVVCDLKLPVILVIGNKLGCLNHGLMTIDAIVRRDIPLVGFILNDCHELETDEMTLIADSNEDELKRLYPDYFLGRLPFSRNICESYQSFKKIGPLIFDKCMDDIKP
jgi:dethiobiotin synthetase